MAQSEQAQLVANLLSKGYTVRQLATLTGRTERYIQHARDSQTGVGRNGKVTHGKGQNLIPALKTLDEKGKLSPAQMPEARKTKSGAKAAVRKPLVPVRRKTKPDGVSARVKKGPATLMRAIQRAANAGDKLKFDVKVKSLTTKSPKSEQEKTLSDKWITGKMDAQALLDAIQNPGSDDTWKPGDVNAALMAIAVSQDRDAVSATGAYEFSLYSL